MEADSSEQRRAAIRYCRNEVRHESGLLIGRLNALLSAQAFLVIAYATSLGSSNGAWRQAFTVLLPPFLAVVGFVLAWEGRRGLMAARCAIEDWEARLDRLLATGSDCREERVSEIIGLRGPDILAGGRDPAVLRRDGNLFQLRTPRIFMVSWIWMAALPFYLFLA